MGPGGIALGKRGVGGLEQILGLAADTVLGQTLEERDHLALRQRAHEPVGRLAIDEGDHGRDRLNTHLAGNGRVLVNVHLGELHLALGGAHRLFEDRSELFARPAPGRPEIDQHRLPLRFLDDILDEGLRRRVLDERVRNGGSSFLQHVSLP